ncbi:MAG: AmmeMemoRadiSam system radical SAM enzyme, partial [Bacteroidota bacterium]|nr:AmmeMemoRadiSam system radical SAM enzyme [Bacteroidota bacterium]
MKKEAKYFEILPEKKVKCTLCPHECILSDGQVGICRARKNINGSLITLVFSNPCAVGIDPIEKKPLYHFLPGSRTFSIGTAGCSLSCKNCQNYSISQASPEETNNYLLKPKDVVSKAIENGCESISYTYTEPMVFYEYMLDTAKLAHQKNLKNIIVSSGFVNQKPLEELIPHIDAANIDLKSFDEKKYKKISSASLQPILNTLLTLKKHNVHLEITNLLIPDYTDDLKIIEKMCNWLTKNKFEETALHFSKFFPTYKLSDSR